MSPCHQQILHVSCVQVNYSEKELFGPLIQAYCASLGGAWNDANKKSVLQLLKSVSEHPARKCKRLHAAQQAYWVACSLCCKDIAGPALHAHMHPTDLSCGDKTPAGNHCLCAQGCP
jgi:hypothetical protein